MLGTSHYRLLNNRCNSDLSSKFYLARGKGVVGEFELSDLQSRMTLATASPVYLAY